MSHNFMNYFMEKDKKIKLVAAAFKEENVLFVYWVNEWK